MDTSEAIPEEQEMLEEMSEEINLIDLQDEQPPRTRRLAQIGNIDNMLETPPRRDGETIEFQPTTSPFRLSADRRSRDLVDEEIKSSMHELDRPAYVRYSWFEEPHIHENSAGLQHWFTSDGRHYNFVVVTRHDLERINPDLFLPDGHFKAYGRDGAWYDALYLDAYATSESGSQDEGGKTEQSPVFGSTDSVFKVPNPPSPKKKVNFPPSEEEARSIASSSSSRPRLPQPSVRVPRRVDNDPRIVNFRAQPNESMLSVESRLSELRDLVRAEILKEERALDRSYVAIVIRASSVEEQDRLVGDWERRKLREIDPQYYREVWGSDPESL